MSAPRTLADIGLWAVKRVGRADKQDDAIEDARNFYLLMCGAVQFEELETTSAEIPLTMGDSECDISALDMSGISSVRLTYETGRFRRLKRSHTRVYDSIGSAVNGIPANYARWAKKLEVNPAPNTGSMTLRLRHWKLPDIATIVGDTVIITPETWDELMRYETLYRVYMGVEDMDKANALIAPMPMPRQFSPHGSRTFEYGIIPKLWNDLLKTIRQVEGADEDFSVNPVVRRYTRV